jgi:hypothetical protein
MRPIHEPALEIRRESYLAFPGWCADCGRHTRHRVKVPIHISDKWRWGLTHAVAAFVPLLGLFSLAATPSGAKVSIPICWHCRRTVLIFKWLSLFSFMVALACFMFMPTGDPLELIVGVLGVLLLCIASALSVTAAFLPLPVSVTKRDSDLVYRFRTGAYRDWLEEHTTREAPTKPSNATSGSAPSAEPEAAQG